MSRRQWNAQRTRDLVVARRLEARLDVGPGRAADAVLDGAFAPDRFVGRIVPGISPDETPRWGWDR